MCAHDRRAIHHHGSVSLYALAMKCRGGDASLPFVNLTIAGNQAIAEQDLHPPLCPLLDEVLRLIDQDFANELWLVQKD